MRSRYDLPYVEAVLKEVCRYEIEVPLSVARTLVEDAVYKGALTYGKFPRHAELKLFAP